MMSPKSGMLVHDSDLHVDVGGHWILIDKNDITLFFCELLSSWYHYSYDYYYDC